MDLEAEDVDADDDTPEVCGEKGDVEDGGAAHAEDDGGESVEEGKTQGVAYEPAGNVRVPSGVLEGLAVEDGGLDAVDDHTEHANVGQDVVHGSLGDEPFLEDVAGSVEGGAEESEKVSLDGVFGVSAVGAGDVVGGEEDAHASAADEDTDDLE